MGKRKNTSGTEASSLNFEQAMGELETIIERIESGGPGLEESLAEYERGVALMKRCRQILAQTEQRVEKLKAEAEEAAGGDDDDEGEREDDGELGGDDDEKEEE